MLTPMFNTSNSLLEASTCEAAYLARYKFDRANINKSLYGELGSVCHSAFEKHFAGGSLSATLEVLSDEYDKVIEPGTVPDKPEMSKKNLMDIITVYCQENPVHSYPFKVLELEKVIGFHLHSDIIFWAKRDMLVQEMLSGAVSTFDHKMRFGWINDWWSSKFDYSSQMSGYIFATKLHAKKLSLRATNTAYINAVSLAKLPDSTKRCPTHRKPYNECRLLHVNWELMTFGRTEGQLRRWFHDATKLAFEAKTLTEKFDKIEYLQYAPRSGAFRGACTFCEFQKWCKMDFDLDAMESLTKESRWATWETENKEIVQWQP